MVSARIMIVDDSLELGRMLQTTLLTADPSLTVLVVPSGEEALLEASRKAIDLLIADIRLPGMDGMELVRRVRKTRPGVKSIMMTGMQDERLQQRSLDAGADYFLRKPLDMQVFLQAVDVCLGIKTAYGEPKTAPVPSFVPEPAVVPPLVLAESAKPVERLPDLLMSVRQEMGALAALLLDGNGHLIAQAGDLPDIDFKNGWIPAVMGAASAILRLSHMPKLSPATAAMGLHGAELDLVLAPLGEMVLLVVLKAGRNELRLTLTLGEVLHNYKDLVDSLGINQSPAPARENTVPALITSAPLEPAPVEEPIVEDEFAALFSTQSEVPKPVDADSFWESADSATGGDTTDPDVLSYEQARKLGLAPGESGNGG